MNSAPLSTGVLARLARAGIVIGSLIAASLLGVVVSDDFRSAVAELVKDSTLASLVCALLFAALTQVAGHLAGKTRKP